MKTYTISIITGPFQRKHFALSEVSAPSWPVALFGLAEGPNMKQSKAEAEFFASAPTMLAMLKHLTKEFGQINQAHPLSPGKVAELSALTDRAASYVAKHKAFLA